MTFGMISIAETTTDIITLDTPIEELNDLTLNELFIDNNELNGLTFLGQTSSLLLVDDIYILTIISPSNVNRIETFQNLFIGSNVYYVSTSIFPKYGVQTFHQLGALNSAPYIVVPNIWNITSSIITNPGNSFLFRYFHNSSTNYVAGDIWKVKDFQAINLTALGLTSLTKTQMDNYFDIYKNGGYYEYDAVLNDLDMTDFIIISSSFVLWLWFMRFVKGVL
jgi:hypothetical protein